MNKEIMKRTKLRNNFLKNRAGEKKKYTEKKYTKQRNFCVSLLRKAKHNYLMVITRRTLLIIENFGKLLKQCFPVKIIEIKK